MGQDRGPVPWKGRQEGLKRGLHVYSRSGWAGVLWLAEWHLWAGGSHLLLAAAQTHGMTSGPWAPAQQPLPSRPPPIVPGSFSHLGTLPRPLLTGWAVPGLGSGGPTAPSSAVGSNSTGAGSGAGGGGGVPAALDMDLRTKAEVPDGGHCGSGLSPPSVDTHLATSTSAADGETVCSSSVGSR